MQARIRFLVLGLIAVGLLGAYWVASAQEGRPLFAPPGLPTERVKPAKGKKADATLIVPAEAYDVPRPVKGGVVELNPGVVSASHVEEPMAPKPLPVPAEKEEKDPGVLPVLPTLPAIDERPAMAPLPAVEPTKLLIVEPTGTEAPKRAPMPLPPPTLVIDPEPKQPLVAPPPVVISAEPKRPVVALPPVVINPEPKQPLVAPPTVVMPAVAAPERPRSFVRIESGVNSAPPISPLPQVVVPDALPQPAMLVANPPSNALANIQTPSVSVSKQGAASIRAGETRQYQITVQNRGPGAAQQIRVEDEMPANVQIVSADPIPVMQGAKAVWTLPALAMNHEQVLRVTLKAGADAEISARVSVQVGALTQTNTTVLRPRNDVTPMAIELTGPAQVAMGKTAVFEIRVANPSAQPLAGIVLHGLLPEGLNTPNGRAIEGEVDLTIAPGDAKVLKMPANAVKPGRYTVAVKVTTHSGHEASATAAIEVGAECLQLQQAPATRLFMGRDGDLRIELANHTTKALRNVAVADQLPDGLEFVAASDRGLYQANRRTVYWLIDQLPPGKTQTLVVRVNGTKAGEHQNVVYAKADGVGEAQSSGVVALEGVADLTLRVEQRDPLLELGKETIYEIQVQNPGNVSAANVRLQVQFPAGLVPSFADAKTRHTMDRRSVVFEPIATLEAQGTAVFRVSATAQANGDQRVQFSVVSDQVRLPIQREISTRVYSDRAP